MTTWTVARSVSRPAQQQLTQGPFVAQVLAVFERACNLVTPAGNIIALVTPQIGDGPLNIVIDSAADFSTRIDPGAPVTFKGNWLRIDGLSVDLGAATVWEPRPDWDTLRTRCAVIASHLSQVRMLAYRDAPANTLLDLLRATSPQHRFAGSILATAQNAAEALQEGWENNQKQLQLAGFKLTGLGSGLTPAGDDFLAGVMLWAWLAHPHPHFFGHTLLQMALPRTTTFSAAYLRAASRGECSVSWHTLLTALSEGTEVNIAAAVQQVLAHGATSGADGLAGFLYLPLSLAPAKMV